MNCVFLCFVFALLNGVIVRATNENYTFTYAMAMQCSEHICKHGYSYETFYRIDEKSLRYTKLKKDTGVPYFEMHIAIQAASNGHILLSPVAYPSATDSVYEIVVGGGANKFTELRLNLKRNARGSAKTPNILSAIEFTAFYIKISEDGLIEFGKEGDSLPIVSYYDTDTLPIQYFSFASWSGVEAKFLFDCPSPDDSDAMSPNSQVVEPKLSNSDELKRSMLMSRLPSIAPGPNVSVKLGLKVTHVQYDARTTKLFTSLAVVTSWTDDSMAWDPSKFNGTTSLKFSQGQIWRPMFFVFNSDKTEMFDTMDPGPITMVNSGEATFHFQTHVTTWCISLGSGSIKWPHDIYTCSIVIEPWEVHEKISIEILEDNDRKMKLFADSDIHTQAEWEFSYKKTVIRPALWDVVYRKEDNETHQSDRYLMTLTLKRSASTYNIVFYTPLLVLVSFILMSFWSEPLESFRECFYAGCTIVICIFLSGIDNLVPTHSVPSILVLFTTVLYGVLLALHVHVFLTSPWADWVCRTMFVQTIFTFSLFRIVFCLPPFKISINGDYLPQEDDDEEATTSAHVEEMESEKDKAYGDRRELAGVLDKLMFVVYSITFASMMAAHY